MHLFELLELFSQFAYSFEKKLEPYFPVTVEDVASGNSGLTGLDDYRKLSKLRTKLGLRNCIVRHLVEDSGISFAEELEGIPLLDGATSPGQFNVLILR